MSRLPAEFASLEHFVDDWVLSDSRARSTKRFGSDYGEVREFYDQMLAVAPAVLEYLSARQLGDMDEPDERLLKLMLSLAEIGPAIEWYEEVRVKDAFPPHRFTLTQQIPDCAAQE